MLYLNERKTISDVWYHGKWKSNIKDLLWSIQKQAKKVENIFHFQRQKNVFYRSFVHSSLPFLCAACQHNCISHNHYSDTTTTITTIAHTSTTTTLSSTLPLPSLSHYILLYNTNNLFCGKKNYICFASNTWSVNLILINP